jgi:hypothetical protein
MHVRTYAVYLTHNTYISEETAILRLCLSVAGETPPINEILSTKLARITIHCYRTLRVHRFVLVQVNMF